MEGAASARRMESLDAKECRVLLERAQVGRLGVVRGGYPLIFPVNYVVHGDRIVIRTDDGPKLRSAANHRVSFEVDEIDGVSRCGWSVLVQGFGTELPPHDAAYAAVRALAMRPWAPGNRDRLLVIAPIRLTGRRISCAVAGGAPR